MSQTYFVVIHCVVNCVVQTRRLYVDLLRRGGRLNRSGAAPESLHLRFGVSADLLGACQKFQLERKVGDWVV